MSKIIEEVFKQGNEAVKKQQHEYAVKALLSQDRRKFQGIGTGVLNNVFYIGTSIDDNTAIITNKHEVFMRWNNKSDEIKEQFGLDYRFEFWGDLLEFDWSYSSIQEFLFNLELESPGLPKCFEAILEKQKQFIWHFQKGYHETIACSILSTYFMPVFPTKGRDFFNAQMGSGKTQQASIYAGLAFHALPSGNISGASVYRVIESIKPTIIVDDYDKIPEEQKQQFEQSLRVGYKKGLKAIRADDKRPMGFDLFAHMVLNNIGGLDEVSENRCTKHSLMKCPDDFKAENLQNEIEKWQAIRDMLYTTALFEWEKVKDCYNALQVPALSSRDLERDKATLTIANLCDCYDLVLEYLLESNRVRKITAVEDDWFYHLLKWWNGLIVLPKKYSAKDMANNIAWECLGNPEDKEKIRSLAWHIGKFLSSYPIIKTSIYEGSKVYELTQENLWRIASAKGYNEMLGVSPPTPPTQPNQLNTPNPPNTLKKDIEKPKIGLNADLEHSGGGYGGYGGDRGQEGLISEKPKEAPENPGCSVCSSPKAVFFDEKSKKYFCSQCFQAWNNPEART